ncbi:acyltransferase [Methanosarcina mazei]|uniref:Galactoside O-acetyltransferase n=1 Tax=Methanosarcina mazei TaxID=2209 RepID=A0A0F8JI38_METMZ|nr:acyltransferase [Methanosarcina mazei]KKG75433.1 hypothetical protein DU46_13990 [Methanosarcina mazei]KKG77439.1 hypothetical protein DU61_03865 [Methanosarcina mazei]KKH06675.1 hypothetical protein DU51_02655 [Methanosarcina mazei]KKH07815.1 hypothetical protein DU62_03100 [Methanosarcina mazei]
MINSLKAIIIFAIRNLPGPIGLNYRNYYYSKKFKSCGSNLSLNENIIIKAPGNITIGNNFYMGPRGLIDACDEIIIGDDVLVGMNVQILSSNHNFDRLDIPINLQGLTKKRTYIGNDVWIGAGVIILACVHIGDGCVIGAGSVVTKSITSYSVAIGNPASVMKSRLSNKGNY